MGVASAAPGPQHTLVWTRVTRLAAHLLRPARSGWRQAVLWPQPARGPGARSPADQRCPASLPELGGPGSACSGETSGRARPVRVPEGLARSGSGPGHASVNVFSQPQARAVWERGRLQFSLSHPLPRRERQRERRGGEGGREREGGERGRKKEGERSLAPPPPVAGSGPPLPFQNILCSTRFFRQRTSHPLCPSRPARAGPPPDPGAPAPAASKAASSRRGPGQRVAPALPGPLSSSRGRPAQRDLRPRDSGPPPPASPSLDGRPPGVALGLTRPSAERQLRQPRHVTSRLIPSPLESRAAVHPQGGHAPAVF